MIDQHQGFTVPQRIQSCTLFLLILLLGSLELTAQCQFPDNSNPGDPEVPTLRASVQGEDVNVEIFWPATMTPATAQLLLITADGQQVIETAAEILPGEVSETQLHSALVGVSEFGFQYRLQIQLGSQSLADEPFRVQIRCPDQLCHYELVGGLEAGGVVVSLALWQALEIAKQEASDDLIGWVRDHRPELAEELPGFDRQLQQNGPTGEGGCRCQWVGVHTQVRQVGSFGDRRSLQQQQPQRYMRADGGQVYAGVQSRTGTSIINQQEIEGTSFLGIQLLCTRSSATSFLQTPTQWPSLPLLKVEEPKLILCPPPCDADIRYQVDIEGTTIGAASSRSENGAEADAEIAMTLQIDGQNLLGGAADIRIDMTGLSSVENCSNFADQTTGRARGFGVMGEVHSIGTVETSVAPPTATSLQNYGLATAQAWFAADFFALPYCSEVPEDAIHIKASWGEDIQEGGVAIERWEDN